MENQGGQVWAKKTVMRMPLSSAKEAMEDWMEWCKWASGRAIYSRGRDNNPKSPQIQRHESSQTATASRLG